MPSQVVWTLSHILLQVDFLALRSVNLAMLVLCSVAWFKAILCCCYCMVILGLIFAVFSFVNHFGEELRVKQPSVAKVILSIKLRHLREKSNTSKLIFKCPKYLPEMLLIFSLDRIFWLDITFFAFASYDTIWQASLKVRTKLAKVFSEPLVLQSWNILPSQQFSWSMLLSFNLSPQNPLDLTSNS